MAKTDHADSRPRPTPDGPTPRPAATIVVVRDAADGGIEVLLSRRAERGDHNSNAWVFPGGVVDPGDRDGFAVCAGLDDAAASTRLGLTDGGLAYFVAAIRECFEESGLFYASDARGRAVRLDDGWIDERHRELGGWRTALHRGERSIAELCRQFDLRLAVDRLVYLSHWLTPLGRAKRFDTRFFVAAVPDGQTAAFDGTEMLEQCWIHPTEALDPARGMRLMTPTEKTLGWVARFPTVAALLDAARAPRDLAMITPRLATGRDGPKPIVPGEPAYAEIGRIDPSGRGTGRYDIQPDEPVRLSPRVIRVTAGNGSLMTGPGTNTYLVGGGDTNEWAVIDPGPDDEAHIDAIVAAAPGPIRSIFVTHTHKDHSPGCLPLKRRTGARVHGRRPAFPEGQDPTFATDVPLTGGERFELPGATLEAIHTPGHASNHLCYRLVEEKLLFTGDHVMQLSTVVINPPDGDMAAYLRSLDALAGIDLDWLAPGHGFLMDAPQRAMQAIVAHRLKREAKLVEALRELGPADAEALLLRVYDDVKPQLHPPARRSLLAHLLKLEGEGAASRRDGLWSLVG